MNKIIEDGFKKELQLQSTIEEEDNSQLLSTMEYYMNQTIKDNSQLHCLMEVEKNKDYSNNQNVNSQSNQSLNEIENIICFDSIVSDLQHLDIEEEERRRRKI